MREILGVKVTVSTHDEVVERTRGWAARRESRAVFFANVHMLMEAYDDPQFCAGLNAADIVNPDGMPVVWSLRAIGERNANRVYGPDAMEHLLEAAQESGIPIGFYGGTEKTLAKLVAEVQHRYGQLNIVFTMSPPFRTLDSAEDEDVTRRIAQSGAQMLFVGLGCPKQERWIMNHHGRIPAVMFGVGAAFDFFAGTQPQAPRWMMRCGLEWLFRLAAEPRRLARRYFRNNPRFMVLFARQLAGMRTKSCRERVVRNNV